MPKIEREGVITLLIILLIIVMVSGYFLFRDDAGRGVATESAAERSLTTEQSTGEYTNLDGLPVDLEDHIGKTIVAISWASWCPSCDEALLALEGAAADLNSDELVILAINRAEPITTAERYLKNIGDLKHVELVIDTHDKFYQSIEGYAMPETVIFGKDGEKLKQLRGEVDTDSVEVILREDIEK